MFCVLKIQISDHLNEITSYHTMTRLKISPKFAPCLLIFVPKRYQNNPSNSKASFLIFLSHPPYAVAVGTRPCEVPPIGPKKPTFVPSQPSPPMHPRTRLEAQNLFPERRPNRTVSSQSSGLASSSRTAPGRASAVKGYVYDCTQCGM